MEKKTFRELFDDMHHGKHDFDDFISSEVNLYYETTSKKNFYIPNKKLKAFHTFLNLFVFEYLPINERVVFSYRKGFSAYDAVSPHTSSKFFFQTDISTFFARINRSLIKKTLTDGLNLSPVSDLASHVDRILELVCINDALPVGFPSSAPISNAVLYNFDNSLEETCASRGATFTRYSDDIIISSNEKSSLEDIASQIEGSLNQQSTGQFELNQRKSKYFQVGGKIKILGMMILPNGKITIDSALKRTLETLLLSHAQGNPSFLKAKDSDDDKFLSQATGYLNYANSIDQDYVDKLRRRFGATTIDTLLHRPLPKSKTSI